MARLSMLLLAAVVITGCGTLFNAKVKTISMSSNPTQAEVWINGTMRGTTPLSLELDNQRSHTVVFRKEGHADVACELRSNTGAGWIILDILGGLIPVIIDAATGDWNGIGEDVCNVNLPSDPVDGDDRDLTRIAKENGWVTFR